MDPTTLLEFAQQKQAHRAEASQQAGDEQAAAQQEVSAQGTMLSQIAEELGTLQEQIEQIRAELGHAETPADGEEDLEALHSALVALGAKETEALAVEQALEAAKARSIRASEASTRADADLLAANAELEAAEAAAQRRQENRDLLAQEPASTLMADAAAALAADPFTAAQARIDSEIPAALLSLARAGRGLEARRTALAGIAARRAEDAEVAEQAASNGVEGIVAQESVGLRRAEEALESYVRRGPERFSRALASLTQAADPEHGPLTAAQQAAIAATDDPMLQAERDAAAAAGDTVLQARRAVLDAEDDLAAARLAFLVVNPDAEPAEVDADPGVQAAQAALVMAEGVVTAAEADVTAEVQGMIDAWEASVPDDTAWRRLNSFDTAAEILQELGGINPANLGGGLTTAETNLLAPLIAVEENRRTLALLDREVAAASDARRIARQFDARRQEASLRGEAPLVA